MTLESSILASPVILANQSFGPSVYEFPILAH